MPVGKGSILRASDAVRTEEKGKHGMQQGDSKNIPAQKEPYFTMIAVEELKEAPKTWFKNAEKLPSEALLVSVKKFGILEPIIVYQTGEKQYTILSGYKRTEAAKKCSLHRIPAVVMSVESQNEAKQYVLELQQKGQVRCNENQNRKPLQTSKDNISVQSIMPHYLL